MRLLASAEIQLITLPDSKHGPGFALLVMLVDTADGMTESEIGETQEIWREIGHAMGARCTTVFPPGAELTIHGPAAGGVWPVPPGPCPSAFRILGVEGEMYSCDLLATHAGRHRCVTTEGSEERPLMWGEVQLWPPNPDTQESPGL